MVDVETIRMSARQLEKAYHDAAFGGAATAIRVTDPLFLIGTLIAAADEIEALRKGVEAIAIEAEREQGHWQHLKRVIGLQARALLKGASDNGQG